MPSGLIFAIALIIVCAVYPPFAGLFIGFGVVVLLRAIISKILE